MARVINIVLGLMCHGSRHSCHCCFWRKGSLDHDAPLRTFESIREWNLKWIAAGEKAASLKDFYNCRSTPMAFLPLSGVIAFVIPHGKVHLAIGITNDIYNDLVDVFPEAKAWPERLHLQRADYFGGTWEGRQCSTLLANVDVLQEIVDANDEPRRVLGSDSNPEPSHVAQPFVEDFRSFKDVTKKCFGYELVDGWEESISTFEEKYCEAGWYDYGLITSKVDDI